mmetsp:Transcript_17611/g.14989  ORF Transcript_17611/g.14989 Transcript_17611/m.14989 type:complete len:93 (+) Transcript_17611:411-689(+)
MTLAFAGTCASTTVLHDMKYPQARRRVVYWGLCIIAIVYFLVSLSGYIGWGNSLLKLHNMVFRPAPHFFPDKQTNVEDRRIEVMDQGKTNRA